MNRQRRNSEAEHRALYKRTSISRKPEELMKRRMAIDEALRKKHREQLITAKRFRNLTRREEYESAGQVQALANDLRSSDASTRIEAAQYIGKFVLEPAEALIKYITEEDCILALTVNIAAGPYELWKKSTLAVPYLISLLDSDNMNLREIAAGALGNMAAEDLGDMNDEDDKIRAMIRNNGAIKPLTRMLDTNDVRLIQSACFALANLARGEEKELEEFLNVGLIDKLANHLSDDNDTITEICWTISYLTAGSEKCRQQVMNKGLAAPLVSVLVSLSEQGSLVLPVLRTLGNLCGSDDNLKVLADQPGLLSTVIKLVNSEERDNRYIIEQVEELHAIDSLSELLTRGAFDIRKGAAYCIMNIANHGPEHLDQLCHKRLLPSFLDLLRSQEAEMIRLALGYIELLLTQSAKGKEAIDAVPECMEALAAVTPAPDQELFVFANRLVDQYFGESPDMQD
ncbi:ARM repeat-containing protein [Rhizopus microsporus]|uniref:ARM repeat-containing protein n=1 Tax=Rhizopus microsporus TaxID=58291 RepID=A0A1X0SDM6_RHIZD|nr:ARM repeat-containing protein [Rhizopus microsporus]